jgi:hypothetical protein
MTSIENQFEFVVKSQANNPNFKKRGAGHDLIIGQSDRPDRLRKFKITIAKGKEHVLETTTEWVIPGGGGYFFAPSLSALQMIAGLP